MYHLLDLVAKELLVPLGEVLHVLLRRLVSERGFRVQDSGFRV